jgi:hypothetical protein
MSGKSLQDYVYGDPAPRRTGDRTSLIVAFSWYAIAVLSKFAPSEALIQGVALLIICQAGSTWWFCRRLSSRITENHSDDRRSALLVAVFASLSALIVALLSRPRVVAAAVIANRLEQIGRHPKPDAIKAASSLISVANTDRLLLPTRPIEQIVAHRLTINDITAAVAAKIDQEAIARGIPMPLISLVLSKTTLIGDIILNGASGVIVNRKEFQVENVPGSLVPPDMLAFFAPIGSPLTSPRAFGASLIRINGPHVKIPLDGLHCKNVILHGCTLVYTGKPLKLENCGFSNSTFQFSENLTCQYLAEAILDDPSVTITLE